jgi:DNA polymerase III sliding clamp (beta) subunit (PCNA family)
MLYLPPALGALARLAAKDTARYAVNCIRVFEYAEGRYRAEATDGKRLLVVRGGTEATHDFGQPVDDEAHEGLIPANDWREGFRKLLRKRQPELPMGLSLGAKGFRFASPSEEINGQPGDGRYPAVEEVIPRKPPLFSVRVDPALLAGLLDVAAQLSSEEDRGVWLHFYKRGHPFGLSGGNAALGLCFDGVFMPLG